MNQRLLLILSLLASGLLRAAEQSSEMTLSIETNHPIASFDPRAALGAGLDGHWQGETKEMYTSRNINRMLGAGLGPVSVRLRTELAVEAWHWNPKGSWSDPGNAQGYWTSGATPDPSHPILLSYGYKLPRRGNTLDEANDDGYSMLDDGDPKTFWKSNPYLSKAYTGEPDATHPQWVVLDFGKQVPVNVLRIQWAEPYATKFFVEYAKTGRVYFGGHPWNVWKSFPHGRIDHGNGGGQEVRLSDAPVMARYLRVWMTGGSQTALAGSSDPRDAMGYAIREISAGTCDAKGVFHDQITHSPDHLQTLTYASSTDPWHRAQDRDPHVEQPGVDLIAQCGITRGLPIMLSIPVYYDTPENAAALASYIRRNRISVGRYELGEEPDGQRVGPKDFGALYAQTARAMRGVLPAKSILGGPSFVTVDSEKNDDTYRFDHRWWIRDFRHELSRQGQSANFQFLSFEWYPFDEVGEKESDQLPRSYEMLGRAMKRLLPLGIPLVVGEANYSVFSCQQEVDLGGALLNAEMPAQFLSMGGSAFYFYSYEPNKLEESYDDSWGNQMMLLQSPHGADPIALAPFYALRLLTQEWMSPLGGEHQAYSVKTNLPTSEQNRISIFALKRPDKSWALLVINKNVSQSVSLSLKSTPLKEASRLVSYSAQNYVWRPDGATGHPLINHAPSCFSLPSGQPVVIPPWSVSVISEANVKKTN